MTLKAVIFDMGDTLIRRPPDRRKLARAMNDRLLEALALQYPAGVLPAPDAFHERVGTCVKRFDTAVEPRNRMLRALLADYGWPAPSNESDLLTAWHAPMIESSVIEPDLSASLDSLQGLGLRLAILSNTGWPMAWRDRELEAVGILDYFPVRLYSCDLGIGKPDPQIFRTALDRLGDMAPEEAIYVGDSLKDDVAGAHRVGLRTAWLAPAGTTRAPKDAPVPPDLVLAALRELPGKLAECFSLPQARSPGSAVTN